MQAARPQLVLPFDTAVEAPAFPPEAPRLSVVGQAAGTAPGRGDRTLPAPRLEFVRMRRARRYILRVRPGGILRVTIPRGGSRAEAATFVAKHAAWIERERARLAARSGPPQWIPGTPVLLRGESVPIEWTEEGGRRIVRYGERIVSVPEEAADLRPHIEADLRRLARVELGARLHELAARHGLTVSAVSIRNQRSRWGSCSREGRIALNYRLVQMPPHVRDYVLLHELMHLHQQNHSRRFWRLVAAVCPGFREAERWLKTDGRALF